MNEFAHAPSTVRVGGFEVFRLGFGAMQLPGHEVWGEPANPERAREVLRRVVAHGINFIDTSWYYGPLVSNRLIAETLYPYPEGLVIATKLGGRRTPDKGWASALRPDELRAGCEEDLRSLRKERIDVVHLRWINHTSVPFGEALGAMIDLQAEGKVAHIALSNVTLAQLHEALGRVAIVGVQNLYNAAAGERRLGSLPIAAVADQEAIVDLCAARGLAFTPFFPLAVPGLKLPSPALTAIARRRGVTEAQVAIAWLLARSPTMLPIAGTSSPEHLDENWAARKLALSPEERAEIAAARA